MNILAHEMFMWTEDEKIVMTGRVQTFCGFHSDPFFCGVNHGDGESLNWTGWIVLGSQSLFPNILPSEDSVGFSIMRLCMKCIYCSWHAQGLLAVVWDVCEKLLRTPDARVQSHHMARSDVCDGAHSDPDRGRTLVKLLRCCMCGFMSDKAVHSCPMSP